MRHSLQYASLALVVVLGGFGLSKILQPAEAMQTQQQKSGEVERPLQNTVSQPQSKETQQTTTLISQVPQQVSPELIQQRDELYQAFEQLSYRLSHGQQVDPREVDQLLKTQVNLVRVGALTADDAIHYSQFLKKIMPDMERSLDGYIQQLEQLKS